MMTKQKLKSTEALVKELLEKDELTRNSDNYLYLRVLMIAAAHKGIPIWELNIPRFLLGMKSLGFPPFETVRRSRQKLQRKFPELRASEKVADRREANEETYREFAKS